MKKKCKCCGAEYKVENSDSFFRFDFCTEECEQKSGQQFEQLDMYICVAPLPIKIVGTEKEIVVKDGSKWQRDEKKTHGLCAVHLESLSGNVNDELHWLEIDEQALAYHFQKIN